MKFIAQKLFVLLMCLFLQACNEGGFFTPKEPVMCPGMSIKVERGSGHLKISAEGLKARRYEIDSHIIAVELIPRSQRWYGSLGLYLPSGTNEIHLVLDEGQQHFYSEKEAQDWISWKKDRLGYVYSSDGLVVGWKLQELLKSDQKAVLHVDLWQIYIQGKKPSSFEGAKDQSISISQSSKSCREFKYSTEFSPSSPKTIEGRVYSGRAIDIMNEKRITPNRVEQAIKLGRTHSHADFVVYRNSIKGSDSIRVALDNSGKVVLVGN